MKEYECVCVCSCARVRRSREPGVWVRRAEGKESRKLVSERRGKDAEIKLTREILAECSSERERERERKTGKRR